MNRKLSRRGVVLGGATLLAGMGQGNSAHAQAEDFQPLSAITVELKPAPLPGLRLRTLAGADVALDSFKGKPLVLNFWATWCIPCVGELPELDKLASSGAVTVLAASADRAGAAVVQPFLAKHPLAHLTVLLDPGSEAGHAAQVVGFPTTLIFDASLLLRGRLVGPAAWGGALETVRRLTATE